MRRSAREALQALDGRVRMDLRRAFAFGAVMLVSLAVGHELNRTHEDLDRYKVASYACAALVLVSGVLATRSVANEVARTVGHRASSRAAAPLRIMVMVLGYLLVVIAVLDVVGVDLSQFLVGGAVTGVVLGIAAQQSLANFFAGIVLLMARPYTAGEEITVWNGSIGGPHVGLVTDVGLLYTTLSSDGETMRIPNSVLLASAITHGRSAKVPVLEQDDGPGPEHGGDVT